MTNNLDRWLQINEQTGDYDAEVIDALPTDDLRDEYERRLEAQIARRHVPA